MRWLQLWDCRFFVHDNASRDTSYMIYASQINRMARTASYVSDFNNHNKLAKFLEIVCNRQDAVFRRHLM